MGRGAWVGGMIGFAGVVTILSGLALRSEIFAAVEAIPVQRRFQPAPLLRARLAETSVQDVADPCGGVAVYVYRDFPKAFPEYDGVELLDIAPEDGRNTHATVEFGVPCEHDMRGSCEHVQFWGRGAVSAEKHVPQEMRDLGLPIHETYMNNLPWLFVGYLLAHCSVPDPADAQLFYFPVPFVSLYRAARKERISVADVNRVYEASKEYISAQQAWQRCNGCDHMVAYESPILSADKRRTAKQGGYYYEDEFWGQATLLTHTAGTLQVRANATAGGKAFDVPTFSVPYPTNFQPESDAQLNQWLKHMLAPDHERKPGALLLARPRPTRDLIFSHCENATDLCTMNSETLRPYASSYREYTFSIQPGGDTPCRRGFFDSILGGAVPIVFAASAKVAGRADSIPSPLSHYYPGNFRRFFEPLGWGPAWIEQVAFIAKDEEDAMRIIRDTPKAKILEKRENHRRIIPMMLFWDPTAPVELRERASEYRGRSVVPTVLRSLVKDLCEKQLMPSKWRAQCKA